MKIQKCHITNVEEASKTYPRGNNDALSISKYGSLVLHDAQMVALRAHCAEYAPLVPVGAYCDLSGAWLLI